MSNLFRSEATKFQAMRLEGEVMLAIRLRWLLLGGFCVSLVAIIFATACWATHTLKAEATGRVVVKNGLTTLRSSFAGVVSQVLIADGEHVQAGQTLLVVRPARSSGEPTRARESGNKRVVCGTPEESIGEAIWRRLDDGGCAMIARRPMMVAAVQVVSGQQVASQEPVAELIPTDQRLEAELMIPSSSIGLVSPGQPVTIRYDAFSYRKFGSAAGRIISVSLVPTSPSSIPAATASASEPMYRALVQLNRNTVFAYGKDIPLRPGQTLHATIVIDHLSVLEWLFDSFYAQRAKV